MVYIARVELPCTYSVYKRAFYARDTHTARHRCVRAPAERECRFSSTRSRVPAFSILPVHIGALPLHCVAAIWNGTNQSAPVFIRRQRTNARPRTKGEGGGSGEVRENRVTEIFGGNAFRSELCTGRINAPGFRVSRRGKRREIRVSGTWLQPRFLLPLVVLLLLLLLLLLSGKHNNGLFVRFHCCCKNSSSSSREETVWLVLVSEIIPIFRVPFLGPKFPRNGSVTRHANNGRIYGRRGRVGGIKEGVEMEGTVIKRLRERSFSRSFRHPSPPIFKSLLMARTHASFSRVLGEKSAKSASLSLSLPRSSLPLLPLVHPGQSPERGKW